LSDIKYAYPLILNKVASPNYATPVLRRSRLIDWLNDAAHCRATVIAADAGYGKTTLQGDLDAESIDFLDIVFRLEKAFDIKIERGELFPEDILTSTDYVEDGKVNSAGIVKLRERMPFADLSKFERDPVVQKLGQQLTVQDMCNFVEHKLAAAA